MSNDCIGCEYYEHIGDGYAMCSKEAIPVRIIDDYEPTEYYRQCPQRLLNRGKKVLSSMSYGQMAYQKEDV